MKQKKAAIAIIALLLTGGASAAIVHLMRTQDTNMQQAANDQAERRDTSDTSSDGEWRTDTTERAPA